MRYLHFIPWDARIMLTYKIYDIQRNYITTLSWSDVIGTPSIDYTLDGWCGFLDIQTRLTYDSEIDDTWYFVDVIYTSEKEKAWVLYYRWVFDGFPTKRWGGDDVMYYKTIGIQSLLNNILYTDGGEYQVTVTNTVSNIIQSIIDKYHSQNQHNIFSLWSIDDIEVSMEISDNSLFAVLKKLSDATWYHFFIHPDGSIDFKKYPTTSQHSILMDVDVFECSISREMRGDIKNNLKIISWWSSNPTYQDTSSIAKYGNRQEIHRKWFPSVSSMDDYGNNFIAENSHPKQEIECTVKGSYPTHTITPWQWFSLLNTTLNIKNKQIIKVSLHEWGATIYADKYSTMASIVNKI